MAPIWNPGTFKGRSGQLSHRASPIHLTFKDWPSCYLLECFLACFRLGRARGPLEYPCSLIFTTVHITQWVALFDSLQAWFLKILQFLSSSVLCILDFPLVLVSVYTIFFTMANYYFFPWNGNLGGRAIFNRCQEFGSWCPMSQSLVSTTHLLLENDWVIWNQKFHCLGRSARLLSIILDWYSLTQQMCHLKRDASSKAFRSSEISGV